jgi:hypothetical protein
MPIRTWSFVSGPRLQCPNHACDFQSRSDRPLGVVLVGVWKAKIGKDAVAHELATKPS